MNFYTSAILYGKNVLLRHIENGKRTRSKVPYSPYLFVPAQGKAAQFKSIHGKSLVRKMFDTPKDARNFVERYRDVDNFKIYGSTNFAYVFLNDTYQHIDYDINLVNILYVDIEVASDEGFPSIEQADKEITAITFFFKGKYYTLGLNDYTITDPNHHYVKCKNEKQLLEKTLKVWEHTDPDILTGWNCEFFDLPYMINRVRNLLGEEEANKFSPWGIIQDKEVEFAGRTITIKQPLGIAVLDYLQLYKKFSYTPQESYRLDHIANYELGESKLDYSEYDSLGELYKKDYKKFIDYNKRDVYLVFKLEDKLKFIEQVLALGYDAKVNFQDTFTTVRMWDTIIHNYLYEKGIAVEPQVNYDQLENTHATVIGGYVKAPQIGMHDWVVSFDLNSLYPHLIMQYNISPEVFREQINIPGETKESKINNVLNGYFDQVREDAVQKNYTLAASGCMFDRDYKGFLPTIMEKMYQDRIVYKNKMLDAKKALEKAGKNSDTTQLVKDIAKFNNLQMAKKIQLNSGYGAYANKFFRWFDPKFAESVTMSGQLAIRWIEKAINEFLNNKFLTIKEDYVIACDTDSIYIRLNNFIKDPTFPNLDTNSIVSYLDTVCENILQPLINSKYEELAKYTNATAQKMVMKREAIANKGIWTGKKHYILNMYDLEGVRFTTPKLKIMGIESVRSSTPPVCRDLIKKAIHIIMNEDEETLIKFIEDRKEDFKKAQFEDIAFPRGCTDLDKYFDKELLFKKATPIHVRGAILYNSLLHKLKLEKKYEKIVSGDKIKFAYLKEPNPINAHVIAIKYTLPKQFELGNYIDYNKQFDKGFLEPIRTITQAINWNTEKQNTLQLIFR